MMEVLLFLSWLPYSTYLYLDFHLFCPMNTAGKSASYPSVLIQVIFSAQHPFFTIMRIFLRWAMKRIFLWVMMRATHIYCFKCLVGRAVCPPRPISMHWVGSYGQVGRFIFQYQLVLCQRMPNQRWEKGFHSWRGRFVLLRRPINCHALAFVFNVKFNPNLNFNTNLKFNMTPLPFPSTSTSKSTSFSATTIQADIPQLMCAEKDAKCQIILTDIRQACWQIWTVCCNLPSPGRSQRN